MNWGDSGMGVGQAPSPRQPWLSQKLLKMFMLYFGSGVGVQRDWGKGAEETEKECSQRGCLLRETLG